ncbi:predicted integral membrane protein (plasmid) [Phenylobacterium zucineum HLK1]|jgi:hypothetical protein|uniref:Predicted integral membrane protein n=1 Tax=Phenylobacterium zucineum (strain HLK1) TaxID=450851 RepID=B4RI52_PHEZH|nr:RcnB family protein [Phenylobacterium zucineum]ACG80027.1 predicted integral membrane protein [Phenylobacterium zucineum HLK1]
MKRLAAALAALLTFGASVASAHPHREGYWVYHGRHWPVYREVYVPPPGWIERRWIVGERLPPAYYGPPYVIVDWRARHLRKPPRGHHWVRVGDDVVLAAIATGLITEVIRGVYAR